MKKIKLLKVIRNPKSLFFSLGYRGFFNWLPDNLYLKMVYYFEIGEKLNLESPKTYNEKLQWLKLNDRKPYYSDLVDKFEVRKFITEKVGDQYLIPLIALYDNEKQINFDELPKQFVIKCTHDSGGVLVCKDKSKIDEDKVKDYFRKRLKKNFYWGGREWPYKNIRPRIIVEKYMVDNSTLELPDYKFFCFNGEPRALFVATEREKKTTKFDFFDMNFKHLPFKQYYDNSKKIITKPNGFEEMVYLSKILSKEIPHVRVDFYYINGKVYFGELTFTHFSGFRRFNPSVYDTKFGELINTSNIK